MSAIRITNFLGIAPKIASELLPDTAAQVAENVNLYSGNLLSYTQPTGIDIGKSGEIKTIHILRDPADDSEVFLTWNDEVDVAIAASNEDSLQRFYYTGDSEAGGVPKVSNFNLATDGLGPYPVTGGFYDLGLPLPDTVLTATEVEYTTRTSSSFFRDSAGKVTLNTSTDHGLTTGDTVIVSGFTYKSGTFTQSGSQTVFVDITNHGLVNNTVVTFEFYNKIPSGPYVITYLTDNRVSIQAPEEGDFSGESCAINLLSLNAANVEVTVEDANTFTYFAPGFPIGTEGSPVSYAFGKVELGGLTQNRVYAYTWFTPWLEESIASEPSEDLFIKEGQDVTVSGLPTSKPSGNNFVRGVRLYRTVSSRSGTEFFLLATLWFPNTITNVARASNVATVTTEYPHNLSVDDYIKVANCSISSFNTTDTEVKEVIDDYTFTFDQTDSDVAETSASGTLYIDVSQNPGTTPAIYWGDGGDYTFFDDFDSRLLQQSLTTDVYDPPPKNLEGLISYQNNILVGFVANEVYFSEPNQPHAWPFEYKITLEYDVVGLAAISGALLVLTESYPYLIQGIDPAAGLSVQRIDQDHPCLSRRSIVVMYGAIVWATHGGLAVYSPGGGAQMITKYNYNGETWKETIDGTTIVAQFYRDKYFASHSNGAFIFERESQRGGTFVTTDVVATAGVFDSITDKLYLAIGTAGEIIEWNNPDRPRLDYRWKSKTHKTTNMINIGAARVIADFNDLDPNALDATWDSIDTNWEATTGVYSYTGLLTFRFFADKELIFEKTVTNSDTFRLPTGYRTDTFEVEVESNLRIREIHLGETPLQLKTA